MLPHWKGVRPTKGIVTVRFKPVNRGVTVTCRVCANSPNITGTAHKLAARKRLWLFTCIFLIWTYSRRDSGFKEDFTTSTEPPNAPKWNPGHDLGAPTLLLVPFSARDSNVDHDVDGIRDVQVEVCCSDLPVFRRGQTCGEAERCWRTRGSGRWNSALVGPLDLTIGVVHLGSEIWAHEKVWQPCSQVQSTVSFCVFG